MDLETFAEKLKDKFPDQELDIRIVEGWDTLDVFNGDIYITKLWLPHVKQIEEADADGVDKALNISREYLRRQLRKKGIKRKPREVKRRG